MSTRADDARWHAVMARNAAQDGAFVFAVTSTRIYCRPSCPARRPRRENVLFYDSASRAEQEGFRACRRCNPQLSGDARQELARDVKAYIDARPFERVTLARLSEWIGMSPYHLQRTFKSIEGITPAEYARRHRRIA